MCRWLLILKRSERIEERIMKRIGLAIFYGLLKQRICCIWIWEILAVIWSWLQMRLIIFLKCCACTLRFIIVIFFAILRPYFFGIAYVSNLSFSCSLYIHRPVFFITTLAVNCTCSFHFNNKDNNELIKIHWRKDIIQKQKRLLTWAPPQKFENCWLLSSLPRQWITSAGL